MRLKRFPGVGVGQLAHGILLERIDIATWAAIVAQVPNKTQTSETPRAMCAWRVFWYKH
jgi:hypothetical protein